MRNFADPVQLLTFWYELLSTLEIQKRHSVMPRAYL
jgi:hypothetical protein